jgi:hypothetical protein
MLTQTNPVIKTLINISELVTKKRIHIYAKNCIITLKFKKIIVGLPTQRCQPAPSVTLKRGTVLVNFVGFGNRFLFLSTEVGGRLVAMYLLARRVG